MQKRKAILRYCEGGTKMPFPKSKKERLLQMFDSYLNSTINNSAAYYERKFGLLYEREITTAPEVVEEMVGQSVQPYPSGLRIEVDGLCAEVDDEILYQVLLKVPVKDLKVIILDFWYELKDQEIAECLEVDVRTVYNRRERAKKLISKFYEERAP